MTPRLFHGIISAVVAVVEEPASVDVLVVVVVVVVIVVVVCWAQIKRSAGTV